MSVGRCMAPRRGRGLLMDPLGLGVLTAERRWREIPDVTIEVHLIR